MWLTLTLLVTTSDDQDQETKISVEQQKKGPQVHLREDLQLWLKDNCQGKWQILVKEWQIQFEREDDYVSYCLNWYDR